MKLQSASLYYAICIALIIALTSSAFISYIYFQVYEQTFYETNNRLISETYSGIELLKSKYYNKENDIDENIKFTTFNDDSLILKKYKWGIYDVLYVRAYNGKFYSEKSAIIGSKLKVNNNLALYISNNMKSIGISGNSQIVGDAYISPNGFNRNYIESGTGLYAQFHIGKQLVSNSNLIPIIKNEYTSILKSKEVKSTDSILDINELSQEPIKQSFYNNTIYSYSKNDIYLNDVMLSGNIKIKSDRNVYISKQAQIENISIYGKNIYVEKDASIQCQLIATDSVFIAKNVKMRYPSSIFIMSETQNIYKYISIDKNTSIKGEIYILNNTNDLKDVSFCQIEKNATIEGRLYSNANTTIYGEIFGEAYIHKLLIRNPSAVYENQILNARFDKSKLNHKFLFSSLLNQNVNKSIIKWLD